MNRLLTPITCTVLLVSLVASVSGQVIFDSDFTAADGFADGTIDFGLPPTDPNPDSIVGESSYVVDTSGSGTLTNTSGSAFERALFGLTFGHTAEDPDPFDQALINSMVLGDFLEIEAVGMRWPGNGADANLGVFGLARVNGNDVLGQSTLAAGVQFTTDLTNVFVDTDTAMPANLEIDTGIPLGTAFDYRLRYVAKGGAVFDIEHYLNDEFVTISSDVAIDFMPEEFNSSDTGGFIQDFGGAGSHSVDALRLRVVSPIRIELADFDEDGDIDGADFIRWQQDGLTLGQLEGWETKYGFGVIASEFAAVTVPEPNAIATGLLGLALCGGLLRQRA